MSVLDDFAKVDQMDRVIQVNWDGQRKEVQREDPLDAPMRIKCLLCDWNWTAPAKEVIALHKAHRQHQHAGEAVAVSSPGKGSMSLTAMQRAKRKKKETETLPIRNRCIAMLREKDCSTVDMAREIGVDHAEKVGTILTWAVRNGDIPGLWTYKTLGSGGNVWSLREDRSIPLDPRVAKLTELLGKGDRTTHALACDLGMTPVAAVGLLQSVKRLDPSLRNYKSGKNVTWTMQPEDDGA